MVVDSRFSSMEKRDIVNQGVTANGVYNALTASTVGRGAFSYTDHRCTITRPSNTTQYSANAIVNNSVASTVLPKSSFGSGNADKNILVQRLRLTSNQAPATSIIQPLLRFFPAGAFSTQTVKDGDVCSAITAAESITSQGKLLYSEFGASYSWLNTGSGYEYVLEGLNMILKLDSNGDLYHMLLATNTYTPKSGEIITIDLQGMVL